MLIIVVFIALLMGAPEGDICMGKTKPKAIRTSSLSVCNRNAGGGVSKHVPEKPYFRWSNHVLRFLIHI